MAHARELSLVVPGGDRLGRDRLCLLALPVRIKDSCLSILWSN